jgi:hypothetical protein
MSMSKRFFEGGGCVPSPEDLLNASDRVGADQGLRTRVPIRSAVARAVTNEARLFQPLHILPKYSFAGSLNSQTARPVCALGFGNLQYCD